MSQAQAPTLPVNLMGGKKKEETTSIRIPKTMHKKLSHICTQTGADLFDLVVELLGPPVDAAWKRVGPQIFPGDDPPRGKHRD